MGVPINLPVRGLPGGLLASSSPLTGEWERGVGFTSRSCLTGERIGPCPVDYEGTQGTVGAAEFLPIQLRQGVTCSALSRMDVEGLAVESLAITREALLGRELQDGVASGTNPALVDAVSVGTGLTVIEAIGCLEAAGAVALEGRQITIHVPAGLSIHLPQNLYRDEQGRWRTPLGSIVIISVGYTGVTLFATGEVWTAVSDPSTNSKVGRAQNTDEGWADEIGIVVFDPCWIASAETSISTCGDSPGEGG